MAKKIFRKLASASESLKSSGVLGPLGDRIHDANLWHLNRHSVSRAFFAALFTSVTLMIFPCHMITSAFVAVWIRANLPISITLVWLINPFTIPPLAFAALRIGLWVMPGTRVTHVRQLMQFNWEDSTSLSEKIATFWHLFERVWQPFMLGSLTLGLAIGLASYFLVQLFWRWHVIRTWNARQLKRLRATHPGV